MRVLVAEDHERLARSVAAGLRRYGMTVDLAFDGDDALARLGDCRYDVVILDRDLPGTHGDDVCRSIVARRSESRVLMLTAAGSVKDRVEGLGLGADDYLPKPFDFSEMVARVQALGRRPGAPQTGRLGFGDLQLDPVKRVATRDGRTLALRPKEFAVLECLLAGRGQTGFGRGAAGTSLGLHDGPVHDDGQNNRQSVAGQARRTVDHRYRPRQRLPHRRTMMPISRLELRRPAWLHVPRRTARIRLTALYGGLFLISGAALVAATYLLFERATAFTKPALPRVPRTPSLQDLENLPLPKAFAAVANDQSQVVHILNLLGQPAGAGPLSSTNHPLDSSGPVATWILAWSRTSISWRRPPITWRRRCTSWPKQARSKPHSAPPTRTSCW